MIKKLVFDLDGTIVNLYGVDNWLSYLENHNPLPYKAAAPLVNMSWLARTLHDLQSEGWTISIVSWLSKHSTPQYDEDVIAAKLEWLEKHLPSVDFDEIHITAYGEPKSRYGGGWLVDDEQANRVEWIYAGGYAIKPDNKLIKNLRTLL